MNSTLPKILLRKQKDKHGLGENTMKSLKPQTKTMHIPRPNAFNIEKALKIYQ